MPSTAPGKRETGEGGTVPALAVIINAIVDALAELGTPYGTSSNPNVLAGSGRFRDRDALRARSSRGGAPPRHAEKNHGQPVSVPMTV